MSETIKCTAVIVTGMVCAISMVIDPWWLPLALACFCIVTIVAMRR